MAPHRLGNLCRKKLGFSVVDLARGADAVFHKSHDMAGFIAHCAALG